VVYNRFIQSPEEKTVIDVRLGCFPRFYITIRHNLESRNLHMYKTVERDIPKSGKVGGH
jgi:hypothetical protein